MPQPPGPPASERPRRRRPRSGVLVGAAVVGGLAAVVVLAVAISLLVGGLVGSPEDRTVPVARPSVERVTPRPSPSSPAAQPTQPSSPAPTQGPDAPAPPRTSTGSTRPPVPGGPPFPTEPAPTAQFSGEGLEDNRLYNVAEAPGSRGCADPPLDRPGVPDEELAALAGEILDCLVETMSPLVAEQGFELTAPSVSTYATDVETPCGPVTPEQYPAYYCSYDTTIYLNELTDDTAINYAEVTRGYWLILAHELGHHLQQVSGMFPRYGELWTGADAEERHELTRRLELQATCFAGVQLNLMADSLELDDDTAAELESYAANNNDEVIGTIDHGDAASMRYWLMSGFLRGWGSFGHCRTWSAESDKVS